MASDIDAILKIDDADLTPALLSCADIKVMTETGILPEGPGYELIEGVLVKKWPHNRAPHVAAVIALNRFLVKSVPNTIDVAPATSVFLAEETMLEPDFQLVPAGMNSTDVRGGGRIYY